MEKHGAVAGASARLCTRLLTLVPRRYLKTPGLSAYDIANTVLFMLATPEHMEINDVLVRPTGQHV